MDQRHLSGDLKVCNGRKQSAKIQVMSTAKLAWDTFMRVLADISEAHRIEAPADDVHELFQHANELLDIVNDEINNELEEARTDMRSAVEAMRVRLTALDREAQPAKH
jgi:hypothetical protein